MADAGTVVEQLAAYVEMDRSSIRRSRASCAGLAFSRTARAPGRRLAGTGNVSSGRATSCGATQGLRGKVRVLLTPAPASWFNPAELLLRAFSERYLTRGDEASRADLIRHLQAAWLEYNNNLLAHPFHWSWTRRKMPDWVDSHRH